MKNIRPLFVMLTFLVVVRTDAQEGAAPRSAGRVLLLQSERGLDGDIEKFGEQYRIRRGQSEVWLPADKVARLCVDWEDAYAYMKTRANLGDADERLRLARWCQLNNLRPQALVEAKAALDMRPGHAESRQLVLMLTRTVASPSPPVKMPVPAPAKTTTSPAARDISADSLAIFATRVQPILMNTCVTCHSAGRGGAFELIRTDGGHRSFTQANLAAVLTHVRVDNPSLSPLLIKAVSRHGEAANAPLKDRQAIPYKALQGWIEHLVANNPHLRYDDREPVTASKASAKAEVFAQTQVPPRARPLSPPGNLPALPAAVPLKTSPPQLTQAPATAPALASAEEAQEPALGVQDPFDPAIFNRQAPSRK